MHWSNLIESNKDILGGKPVIKGSRISIELIVDLLWKGWSKEQILESYPSIDNAGLDAAFEFIKDCLDVDSYLKLKKSA